VAKEEPVKRKSTTSPPKAATKKLKAADPPAIKTPKTFYGSGAAAGKTPVLAKTPAAPKTKTPKEAETLKVVAIKGKTLKVPKALWSEIVARTSQGEDSLHTSMSSKGPEIILQCHDGC
jgi:hypothetical protein